MYAPLKAAILILFKAGSSLENYHKLPDVSRWLLLYSVISYKDITTSVSLTLSTYELFISLRQPKNGANILNVTSLLLLFTAAPTPVISAKD